MKRTPLPKYSCLTRCGNGAYTFDPTLNDTADGRARVRLDLDEAREIDRLDREREERRIAARA